MKWFEMGYDRGTVAEQIFQGGAEHVCEGYRRSKWTMPLIAGYVELHHYERRTIYDGWEGAWTSVPHAFYRSLIWYTSPEGKKLTEIIDFNADNSMLVRSNELLGPEDTRLDPSLVWDRAMSVLDESLQYRARQLGILVTAPMIERVTELELAA